MAGAEISGKMKYDPVLNVFGCVRQEIFTKEAVQSKENQDPKRSGKSDPYWKQSGQLHPDANTSYSDSSHWLIAVRGFAMRMTD